MNLDNDEGLTQAQREYFETLARINPSEDMKRVIEQSKRALIRANSHTPEYWYTRENYLRNQALTRYTPIAQHRQRGKLSTIIKRWFTWHKS